MAVYAPSVTPLPGAYLMEFLLFQKLKGRRPGTLEAYEGFLNRFLREIRKSIEDITTQDIRRFLLNEEAKGNKRTTVATKIATLRSFFLWLEREEYIVKSPMRRIDTPKLDSPPPKYLTHEEMEAVRDAAVGLRDQLLVEVLYCTGLRVAELCALNWEDLDLVTKQVFVKDGKGGKARIVLLSTRAVRLIKKYRKERIDESPWFLQSREHNRICKESVERRVRALGEKAQLQKRITPHCLRHSQATHLLEAGVPIDMIQKLLGHSSISTTQIYARTQMTGVEAYFRRVFP